SIVVDAFSDVTALRLARSVSMGAPERFTGAWSSFCDASIFEGDRDRVRASAGHGRARKIAWYTRSHEPHASLRRTARLATARARRRGASPRRAHDRVPGGGGRSPHSPEDRALVDVRLLPPSH